MTLSLYMSGQPLGGTIGQLIVKKKKDTALSAWACVIIIRGWFPLDELAGLP